MVASAGFIAVISIALFQTLTAYGAGDPQLMAGLISEKRTFLILSVPFFLLVAYPVYFAARRYIKYPVLASIGFLFVFLILISPDSNQAQVAGAVARLVFAGLFVLIGMGLPGYLIKRHDAKQDAEKTREVFS